MEKSQFSQDTDLARDIDALEEISLRLSWVSHRRFEQELGAYELTLPQYVALNCIAGHEKACSMTELAESSHQVSATMTGIIDRLFERGLVQRERDPNDRRALRVRLTPAGHSLLERVRESSRERLADFLAALPPAERLTMIDLTRRYLAAVEESFHPV